MLHALLDQSRKLGFTEVRFTTKPKVEFVETNYISVYMTIVRWI